MNQYATIAELLQVEFSIQPIPRLYKDQQQQQQKERGKKHEEFNLEQQQIQI
jgi:hypothetical protein